MWSPLLEAGRPVLASPDPAEPPWRLVVEDTQHGRVTLATAGGAPLPRSWSGAAAVHLTCVGRTGVYLVHVPVVRVAGSRVVVGEPPATAVQRRAYARVAEPVPVACAALDADPAEWSAFTGEVRDLGGGGCGFLAERTPPAGVRLTMALDLDTAPPIVAVGRVLPRDELPTIGRPLTRVEFVLIGEADRDRIVRFVLFSLARRRRAELHAG